MAHPDPAEAKAQLRATMKARRAAQPAQQVAAASAQIIARLTEWELFRQARCLLIFADLPGEPQLLPLINSFPDKQFALPRVQSEGMMDIALVENAEQLVPSRFTIHEPPPESPPLPLADIDLVLAPALAVDACGNRLGFGQGYYDRLLEGFAGPVAAVVFAWQVVEQVPSASHDRRVTFVLHEKGWSTAG